MAEVVRIRGAHGAEFDVDLEKNPTIRERIEAGKLEVVAAPKRKAAPKKEPAKEPASPAAEPQEV